MRQHRFLELAKKESQLSNHHSHKIGCIIAKGNKILGVGHNMMKTHPHSPHQFKNCHAEFLAVLNSGGNVKGSTVYVYRQQKNGNPAISRPCKDCWKYLLNQGVKDVVYSFEGNFAQEKMK